MFKRFLGWLLAIPAFVVIVFLAVANKHAVHLKLDPFRPEAPALEVQAPMFAFLLGALIVGVVLGGLATWMSQGHWRRSARTRAQDAMRWRSEADRLAREREAALGASASTGLGKALAAIRR